MSIFNGKTINQPLKIANRPMINVFIIDDHQMVIEGFKLLLQNEDDIKVVGSELDAKKALHKLPEINPDVILLDINMPGLNGIEACKKITKLGLESKIIAITMHKESSLIRQMLNNGSKGYVLKNAGKTELVEAIESVFAGKTYLDETSKEIVFNMMTNDKKIKETSSLFPKLSRREKEVLQLILEEHTTQEIADKLFISFGTVETHRRNMLIKTGTRNTAGLVKVALEYALLT
ncbi:response regulator transcription factor [Flagellimonas oceanensis]|uniref:response regulator transcription factor n=1 Tax=Flagellimonas oceanensis TaxID=2499163 RepID=UPI00197B398E|nr:response regulator transcription factor [Allomuricauda oceanensis]|tara:strand:- start:18837 stop:19538 length:702 start_codon:yes stop_codon:yes gene_type:complete